MATGLWYRSSNLPLNCDACAVSDLLCTVERPSSWRFVLGGPVAYVVWKKTCSVAMWFMWQLSPFDKHGHVEDPTFQQVISYLTIPRSVKTHILNILQLKSCYSLDEMLLLELELKKLNDQLQFHPTKCDSRHFTLYGHITQYKEMHCSLCKHDFYRHSDTDIAHNPLQTSTYKTKKLQLQYLFKPASCLYEGGAAACFRIWGGGQVPDYHYTHTCFAFMLSNLNRGWSH